MRMFLLWSFAIALMISTADTSAVARDSNHSATRKMFATPYPDSSEGVQNLAADIFGAIRSGDLKKVSAFCSDLVIPDHKTWFVKVFGTDEGRRLDAEYRALLPDAPTYFRQLFETELSHGGTSLKTQVLQKPVDPSLRLQYAVAEAMVEPVPLYDVEGVGIFVYANGGFRYLDRDVLQALSTAPPLRIRIGEKVLLLQNISKVSVIYPDDSKAATIKGEVVVHVLVGTDGTVKEATVVTGDPILGEAAAAAVRQWRYRPTLLNSKPVEVDSTVTVEF